MSTDSLAAPDAAPDLVRQAASAEVLVLLAHPRLDESVVNRTLAEHARRAGPRVAVRDLYALYPDYLIDVAAEQAALAAAKLVVWQHPVHWYRMTPLMQLWVDEVLSFGWAYGPGGDALQGKDLWVVASTGGSAESYRPGGHNRYFFDAFVPPYEQTAALCGLRFLPPLLLHGAHGLTPAQVDEQARDYVRHLLRWPDWPEIEALPECPACVVPSHERPQPEAA